MAADVNVKRAGASGGADIGTERLRGRNSLTRPAPKTALWIGWSVSSPCGLLCKRIAAGRVVGAADATYDLRALDCGFEKAGIRVDVTGIEEEGGNGTAPTGVRPASSNANDGGGGGGKSMPLAFPSRHRGNALPAVDCPARANNSARFRGSREKPGGGGGYMLAVCTGNDRCPLCMLGDDNDGGGGGSDMELPVVLAEWWKANIGSAVPTNSLESGPADRRIHDRCRV
jgi:hypothetical protein